MAQYFNEHEMLAECAEDLQLCRGCMYEDDPALCLAISDVTDCSCLRREKIEKLFAELCDGLNLMVEEEREELGEEAEIKMKKVNNPQFTKGCWDYNKRDYAIVAKIGEKGDPAFLCELTNAGLDFYFEKALPANARIADKEKALTRATREMHANGYLMAAAPDMYEALRDIVEQAEKTMLPIPADLADSIRVFGRAALEKAEGKAKKEKI